MLKLHSLWKDTMFLRRREGLQAALDLKSSQREALSLHLQFISPNAEQ